MKHNECPNALYQCNSYNFVFSQVIQLNQSPHFYGLLKANYKPKVTVVTTTTNFCNELNCYGLKAAERAVTSGLLR